MEWIDGSVLGDILLIDLNYSRTHCLNLGVTVTVKVISIVTVTVILMMIVEVRVGVKLRVDVREGVILSSLTS